VFFLCVFAYFPSYLRSWEPGEPVKTAADLEEAIKASNAGVLDLITFYQQIELDYEQLFQPLNADSVLGPSGQTFTIDGRGSTLKAFPTKGRAFPGFFVRGGGGLITIRDLTFENAAGKGGHGGRGGVNQGGAGGGGLGAGGAIFLHEASEVILENITFKSCRAIGGKGWFPGVNEAGGGDGGGGGSLRGGQGGDGSLLSSRLSAGGGSGAGFDSDGVNGVQGKGGGGGGSGFKGRGGKGGKIGGGGGGGGGYDGGNADTNDTYISGAGGSGDGGRGKDSAPLEGGGGGIGSEGGEGGTGGASRGGGGSGAVKGDPGADGGAGIGGIGGSLPGGGGGGGGGRKTGAEGDQNTGQGGIGGEGFGGGGGGAVTSSDGSRTFGGSGGSGGRWGGGGGGGTGDPVRGNGGKGGFGGGGGGAGGYLPDRRFNRSLKGGKGGDGGFGGGGGGGSSTGFQFLEEWVTEGQNGGGDGGFGGGGGGAGGNYEIGSPIHGGDGGFGGGAGTSVHDKGGGSGGGAALGGAVFLQEGSKLTIKGKLVFEGSSLEEGAGAHRGEALGKDIFMMSGSTLIFDSDHNIEITTGIRSNKKVGGGAKKDRGGLEKRGVGTLKLIPLPFDPSLSPDPEPNDYTGTTKLAGGVLHVTQDTSLGARGVPFIFSGDGGVLELGDQFASSTRPIQLGAAKNTIRIPIGSATLSGGTISGLGSLFKEGAGTLTLKGRNTYTGNTHFINGVLQPRADVPSDADQALGVVTSALILEGGTLAVQDLFTSSRKIELKSIGTISVEGGQGTLSGLISGAGSLHKSGVGTLILEGANTYMGGTVLSNGVLKPKNDAALGDRAATVTLLGGTLHLAGDFTSSLKRVIINGPTIMQIDVDVTLSGVVSGLGTLNKTGNSMLILSHPSDRIGITKIVSGGLQLTPLQLQGNIDILPTATLIFDQKRNGSYAGSLSGSGKVIKTGSHILTLSHPSHHSGPVIIRQGTLKLTQSATLGQANPLTIERDGILSLFQVQQTLQVITLEGAGQVDLHSHTLEVKGGTFSGILSSGPSVSGGLTKLGRGTLSLTGRNTYLGRTTIRGGTLDLGTSGIPGQQNDMHIEHGALELGDGHPGLEVRMLTGTANSKINLRSSSLQVQRGTFSGVIEGEMGSTLEKSHVGTLILDGTDPNTFERLSLQGGILQCSMGQQLGDHLFFDGGTLVPSQTLSIASPITVAKQSTVTIPSPLMLTLKGALAGNHPLIKTGLGVLVFDSDSAPFRGELILREGTLILPKGKQLGEEGRGGTHIDASDATLIGAGRLGFLKNTRGTVEVRSQNSTEMSTLSIDGNYEQGADATLKIRITPFPDRLDLLKVKGTATLNGDLLLAPQPGIYLAGTTYTILEAQAVQNTFKRLIETHPLEFDLLYPDQETVRIKIAFTETVLPIPLALLKGNARQIGDYLFSCRHSPSEELTSILQPLVQLPPREFIQALLDLGPQQFGGILLDVLESNVRIAHAANRVETLYYTHVPPSSQQSAPPSSTPSDFSRSKWIAPSVASSFAHAHLVNASQKDSTRSIWITPIGFYYKRDQKKEQVPFISRTYGFTAGYTLGIDNFYLNIGAGYTDSDLNWAQYHGHAQTQAAYASPSLGYVGKWGYAGMVFSFARRFYDVKRGMHFSEVMRDAQSTHKSHDLLAGFAGAFKIRVLDKVQKSLSFMLTMHLDYLSIFESAYTEVGAGPLNLSLQRMRSSFFHSELMLKVLKQMNWKSIHMFPTIFVGWATHIPLSKGEYRASLQEKTCQEYLDVKNNLSLIDHMSIGAELFVNRSDRFAFKMSYQASLMNFSFVQEGQLSLNWNF